MKLTRAVRIALLALVVTGHAGRLPAAPDDAITREQLEEAIADRDRIIIDLLRRVEQLEEQVNPKPPSGTAPGAPGSDDAPPVTETATAPGPGELHIDEMAAQRALERGLISDGSLLLAPGQSELVPGFAYSRFETGGPTAVAIGPDTFVGNVDSARDRLDTALLFRAGLAGSMQFEASIPYRYLDSTDTIDVDGTVVSTGDRHGSGTGDVRLGLARVLIDEADGLPGLIGRIAWDSATGDERDGGLELGFGFDEFEISLTAVFTRDPMVFFGSVAYQQTREDDDIEPGDTYEIGLGTAVAISPDTSLTISLDQRYADELVFGGESIEGSDQQSATFNLGVSMILGPRTSMQTNLGIGLTEDASDYRLEFLFPIRL